MCTDKVSRRVRRKAQAKFTGGPPPRMCGGGGVKRIEAGTKKLRTATDRLEKKLR